jgi:hypothetical protein
MGGPSSDDWKESLALCILCDGENQEFAAARPFKTGKLRAVKSVRIDYSRCYTLNYAKKDTEDVL